MPTRAFVVPTGRGMNAAFAIGRLCDMEVGRSRLLGLPESERMVSELPLTNGRIVAYSNLPKRKYLRNLLYMYNHVRYVHVWCSAIHIHEYVSIFNHYHIST